MSVDLERLSVYHPTPLEVATFLPYACDQLQAPFHVTIKLVILENYVSKHDDKGKKAKRDKDVPQNHGASPQRPFEKDESRATVLATNLRDDDDVVVTTVCDTAGRLVELVFYRCTQIPRLLMKVIALCVPYQMLLSKITVRWGPLDGLILYEIANILPQSHITEICLDDSPIQERNYYLLLGPQSQLRSLSLARCDLDDDDCIVIASKLRYPETAAAHLALLCLASNAISDAGAAALGAALRTNRTLRYLNLSGNRISDDGGTKVFRSLARFHLTTDEIVDKRKRILDHLKLKKVVYTKCYNELIAASPDKSPGDRSCGKRKLTARSKRASTVTLSPLSKLSTASTVALKAEMMADELLGPLAEPFCSAETVSIANCVYSLGNMTLSYLSLAYNNLTYASLQTLVEVLRYQAEFLEKEEPGLLRVVLDGNLLPAACGELDVLSELLERAAAARDAPRGTPRRSERSKSKSR